MLGLAATAIVPLLLVVVEGGLRLLDPTWLARRQQADTLDRLHVFSPAYGWRPRPGARVRERDAWVQVDPQGRRAHPPGPASGPALALVGDSMAFGHGVGDGETFAAELARRGYQVTNLGVEGFGPDQSLLRLEREGLTAPPRAVLLSFCIDNDFLDATLPHFLYDGRHPKPYFTWTDGALVLHREHLAPTPARRLVSWLDERSFLYGRLQALHRSGAQVESWRLRRERVRADPGPALELCARLVARMAASSRARGAYFVVLLHPSKLSYNQGDELATRLEAQLDRAGLARLDLAALFHARGLRFSDFAFDPTGHMNAAGHRLVAEALAAHLAHAGLPAAP